MRPRIRMCCSCLEPLLFCPFFVTQITETQEPYILASIPMFVIFCGHYLNFNFLSHTQLWLLKLLAF